MLQAFGEYGGRVRKPLRTAGGVLCIGTEITAEQAMKWPKQNRLAMARTETVFWYPVPQPQANTGPATTEGDHVTTEEAVSGDNQPGSAQSVGLSPINPETAERTELRAWLIRAGDEPAPALGDDKLRQRVRDRLAALAVEQSKEG